MTNNYLTRLIGTDRQNTYHIHRRWEAGGDFCYRGGIHHAGLAQLSEHIKDEYPAVFVRRVVNPYGASAVENPNFLPFRVVVLFVLRSNQESSFSFLCIGGREGVVDFIRCREVGYRFSVQVSEIERLVTGEF